MLIAVDGPAAAGKGTLARRLADYYGLAFLDTGSLYRAVALAMLEAQIPLSDQKAAETMARDLQLSEQENPKLRSRETGEAASVISSYPAVRQALLDFQRHFAEKPEGAVLDGRDIGTVIAPDADFKFFITATTKVRAERRFRELQERKDKTTFEAVLEDVRNRDTRDANRAEAPLRAAADAFILDTSEHTADQVFHIAVNHIEHIRKGK